MSDPFANVAKKVIKRLAATNPGHIAVDDNVIQSEFDAEFPDAKGRLREQMVSKTLETVEELVPERHAEAFYTSISGERLCGAVFPVIWPHTAERF